MLTTAPPPLSGASSREDMQQEQCLTVKRSKFPSVTKSDTFDTTMETELVTRFETWVCQNSEERFIESEEYDLDSVVVQGNLGTLLRRPRRVLSSVLRTQISWA